jgi:leucyl/phenylalanyl-tRNA--protein transferase
MPGVLEPELLLDAYRHGIFPMAVNKSGRIGWFSPDPRAIIPLDERFHVPHGLRKVWKRCVVDSADGCSRGVSFVPSAAHAAATKFLITFDTDFPVVICECSERREGTWISKQIIESYCNLHRLGHAHSVEARLSGKLVGGLYGVHIGGAFFGESMFHRATDASKIALVALVERLRQRGFLLLDTQWQTSHLAQFGTYEIPRREYLRRLQDAIAMGCKF